MIKINLNAILETWFANKAQIIQEIGHIPLSEIQWVYDNKDVSVVELVDANKFMSVEDIAVGNFIISDIV